MNKIEGLIRYFHLEDWWIGEFSEAERQRLIKNYGVLLIKGNITATSQTLEGFLKALASFWKPTSSDSILASRIRAKANQILTYHSFDDYWTSQLDDVTKEWKKKHYDNARNLLHNLNYKINENNAPAPIPEKCKQLMHAFMRDDPYYSDVMQLVLPVIAVNPGILQSALAKKFTQFEPEQFRYAMYYGEIIGDVIREKKGRSYTLTLNRSPI